MSRPSREMTAVLVAAMLGLGAAGCGEEDAENAAQDAGETVEQSTPEAERNGENARDEAEQSAEDAAREAEENIPEAREQAEDAVGDAERELEEATR